MKDLIIKKSIELIYRSGLSNFTVRKLAKYSGISTRPLYYYFKNTQDLYTSISTEVLKKLKQYTSKKYTNDKFLNSGVGFVLFAKELPHYYSTLSIKEFWPNQSFENNKADELMRSKASKKDLKIYEIMKMYSLGMALVASSLPEKFDVQTIIKMQRELYNKIN